MREEDWSSKVTSTHFTALSRQVTEAVQIAEGMEGVRLLNNKQEFGANLLLEVVVMRGDQVLGQRNEKRKRGGRTSVVVQEEGAVGAPEATGAEERVRDEREGEREVREEEQQGGERDRGGEVEGEPSKKRVRVVSHKRERDGYSGYTDVVLRRELKKRKYRVNGRNREEMILLLEEDDKTQSVIRWAAPQLEHQGQANLLREGEGEEGGEGDAPPQITEMRERIFGRTWIHQTREPMEWELRRGTVQGPL